MSAASSTGLFVLNPDVEIISVREFPMEIRNKLGGSGSDFILSDRTSRLGSQRIEEKTAFFLRRFLEPRRIVDAVVEHSSEHRLDPAALLEEIYPLVTMLRSDGILVDPDDAYRRPLGSTLASGDMLDGYRIIDCVSELAETEVYKAESSDGSMAAIKYLRSGSSESVRENLKRELSVLQHLGRRTCAFTPRPYLARLDRDDPYICVEWFDGQTLFELIRAGRPSNAKRARIVSSLLEAYGSLYDSGVLHGDVQPGNVLVLDDDTVRLVDFGGACFVGSEPSQPRIGLVPYYEPEVARAVLDGQTPPSPSQLGEQYTVAVLAYSVIMQGSYLMLSLETEAALKQIASEPPRRFDEMGVSWPAVEHALARALSKVSTDRFATFTEFANALSPALATTPPEQHPPVFPQQIAVVPTAGDRREVLDRTVRQLSERYGLSADLVRQGLPRGPTASVYAGAAGVAYALLRVACLLQDSATLAAADVWISRALSEKTGSKAFSDGSVGSATETGPLALFHSETGLYVINALIRYASGDETETRQAISDFVRSVQAVARSATSSVGLLEPYALDATNGAASLLLGAAMLVPLCGRDDREIRLELDTLAADLGAMVQREFARQHENRYLGFAHGCTGAIYSLLRWAKAAGTPPPATISGQLDELAALAIRRNDGLGWPIDIADPQSPVWTGWCHGSAGHLLTWTTASRVLQRDDYLDLALAAGRHIWAAQGHSGPSLCCGGAGEALSLFELARACGDNVWIDRGLDLATRAAKTVHHTNDAQGLFRADVGVAVAAAESLHPMTSVWPICQAPA